MLFVYTQTNVLVIFIEQMIRLVAKIAIMIKVVIATLISLMSFAPIMAQNIKGKIENTKGEPLAFVNVVLLTRGDSAFVKGAVSGEMVALLSILLAMTESLRFHQLVIRQFFEIVVEKTWVSSD